MTLPCRSLTLWCPAWCPAWTSPSLLLLLPFPAPGNECPAPYPGVCSRHLILGRFGAITAICPRARRHANPRDLPRSQSEHTLIGFLSCSLPSWTASFWWAHHFRDSPSLSDSAGAVHRFFLLYSGGHVFVFIYFKILSIGSNADTLKETISSQPGAHIFKSWIVNIYYFIPETSQFCTWAE